MTREETDHRIEVMLPEGKLLGVHLSYLSSDNEVVESMLLKLQQVGTRKFLSELSEPYLRVLYSFISQRITPKWELPPKQGPTHQQWEYLTIQEHRMSPLNSYGREGWELVTIVGDTFYFKRPCNG